jgi:hypothetical protein
MMGITGVIELVVDLGVQSDRLFDVLLVVSKKRTGIRLRSLLLRLLLLVHLRCIAVVTIILSL